MSRTYGVIILLCDSARPIVSMTWRSVEVGYFTTAAVIGFLSCLFLTASVANKDISNQRPHRVLAETINSTSIRLKWRQPKAEIVCPTRRYMIRLKEIDQSTRQSGRSKARVWKFNSSHSSAIVHDLKPNSEYTIRVVAENCEYKWKSSKWISVKTPPSNHKTLLDRTSKDISKTDSVDVAESVFKHNGRPPGQPTNVRTQALENSVFVSWQAPPSDAGSVVSGYMIGYGEGVPDVNWQYLEGRQRNVTIQNLKKATQYVISVSTYNDFGKSTPVYDLVYTKGKSQTNSTAMPAPSNFRVKPLTPTSLRLQWTDSSLSSRQEIKDGRYYNVHYRVVPEGRVMSILVKDLGVVLGDLLPSTRYEFRIRTMREGSMSDFSDTVSARTSDDDEEGVPAEEKEEEEDEEDEGNGGEGKNSPREKDGRETEQSSEEQLEEDLESDNDTEPAESEFSEGFAKERSRQRQKLDHQGTSGSGTKKRRIQPRGDSLYAVRFRSVVYHKITAFVTWPQHPQQTTTGCNDDAAKATVVGYRLRYQQLPIAGYSDPEIHTTKEVQENFLLMENLLPESKYRYQIQYLLGGNDTTSIAWSGEGIIDTHFTSRATTASKLP